MTFKEWTSRRPWKERKQAARIRKGGAVHSGTQQPELIYYGCQSGVVGLKKSELYRTFCDSQILSCGYDKVTRIILLSVQISFHFSLSHLLS